MKAITIIQPWATLIALGEKQYETRGWARKHRGLLAIHAGKKVDKEACMREPIKSTLAKHGYDADNLPTGAIIAISTLWDCLGISRTHQGFVKMESDKRLCINMPGVDDDEYAFGDYTEGRFAWELTDVKQIEPIPAKGQQGMWNYTMEG